MKFILGTKKYMTQIFNEEGKAIPGTIVEAGPVVVTQIKTETTDGYNAIQVGFGQKKTKTINRAITGHSKKALTDKVEGFGFRSFKEFRVEAADLKSIKIGDTIDLSVFSSGDEVVVSGISKGKGFQGVVKRHGFHGGPRTHGQKHSEREPGSIGAGGVQRVFKGMRMAGRMGTDRVTVKNLKIVQVNKKANELFISGAIPGRRGTLVEIRRIESH